MIWLTWRQLRIQAWTVAAILVVAAVAFAATAPGVLDLYRGSGLADCTRDCSDVADAFLTSVMHRTNTIVYLGGSAFVCLLPAVIGAFWGAPLVAREIETGTYRLIWNQSVSRRRWLVVRLAGTGAVAIVLTGLASLAVTWWATPIDGALGGRLTPLIYAGRGVVPLGYAALAFLIGVTAGMLTKRVVLAMALTLVLAGLAPLLSPFLLRPYLATPVHETIAVAQGSMARIGVGPDGHVVADFKAPAGSWAVSNRTLGPDGAPFDRADPGACGATGNGRTCKEWLATQGLRQDVTYFPADRFWVLQWRELGVFLGAAALLAIFCLRWIRRGVS